MSTLTARLLKWYAGHPLPPPPVPRYDPDHLPGTIVLYWKDGSEFGRANALFRLEEGGATVVNTTVATFPPAAHDGQPPTSGVVFLPPFGALPVKRMLWRGVYVIQQGDILTLTDMEGEW